MHQRPTAIEDGPAHGVRHVDRLQIGRAQGQHHQDKLQIRQVVMIKIEDLHTLNSNQKYRLMPSRNVRGTPGVK